MKNHNSAVGVFASHVEAEEAVRELQAGGFDIKKLSIVGKDQHTDEHVVGYYNAGDRMAYWGKNGAFWGGLWGLLFGAGFFWVPGLGPLMVAGPLVAAIVAAVEGAAIVGGLSALGAALYSVGIPADSILEYETSIRSGKFLPVFHGTAGEVEKSREILDRARALETAQHLDMVNATV